MKKNKKNRVDTYCIQYCGMVLWPNKKSILKKMFKITINYMEPLYKMKYTDK